MPHFTNSQEIKDTIGPSFSGTLQKCAEVVWRVPCERSATLRCAAAILLLIILGVFASAQSSSIHPDLAAALHRANDEGKILLVDFYGDWCPWCIKMDQTMIDPLVKATIDRSFVYYKLDIGNFDRHTGCVRKYAVKSIPLMIAFNADGSVKQRMDGYKPAKTFDAWLQGLIPVRVPIRRPMAIHPDLTAALYSANRAGKLLLVDFYGDWCPWCVKMDEVLAEPSVRTLMAKNFHYYKLDIGHFDRHTDCLKKYEVKSVPHIIIFNPDGTTRSSIQGYKSAEDFKSFLNKWAGMVEYNFIMFKDDADPVRSAVARAARDNRNLIVYFYSEDVEEHVAIQNSLRQVRNTSIAGDFALMRVKWVDNQSHAAHYGCHRTPFLIIFKKNNKVSTFYQEAVPTEKLLQDMRKALVQ